MAVTLIDLSNNNGAADASLIAGYAGVYLKCTEGLDFADPDYQTFRAAAAKVKKPSGPYLFLHPDLDGAQQAAYLLAHAGLKPGDLQPVVDSETMLQGETWGQVAATTGSALAALKAAGYRPVLYGSTSFLESLYVADSGLKAYRVWQADYAAARPAIGGVTVVLWQDSDQGVDKDELVAKTLSVLQIPKPAPKPAWYTQALTLTPLWAWISWRDHDHPVALRPTQIPKKVPAWWWARYAVHRLGKAAT